MNAARPSWLAPSPALLLPVLLAFLLPHALEVGRPDLLIVGSITVDLVDGQRFTGGAVSYAAVAARALKARSCVLTVGGPDADLGIFAGSDLSVVRAPQTLTYEHSGSSEGHLRRLRVTANPNVTLSAAHVPRRCAWARVVLLGPLTQHDVDAASFVAAQRGFWARVLYPDQTIGLLAQGFQRTLGPGGEVLPLPSPGPQLLAGLGPSVSVFLSDVETGDWSEQQLADVGDQSARLLVTMGERGALLTGPRNASGGDGGGERRHILPVKVDAVADTNGAGDTFATAFMLQLMRGAADPGADAAWAASRAVLRPQSCKPRCAPDLIAAPGGAVAPIGAAERLAMAAAPPLWRLAGGGGGGGAWARLAAATAPPGGDPPARGAEEEVRGQRTGDRAGATADGGGGAVA